MTMMTLERLVGWAGPGADVALRGALILAVAAAGAVGLRHRSAALRARVWMLALAGVLALPLLHGAVPALEVSTPWDLPSNRPRPVDLLERSTPAPRALDRAESPVLPLAPRAAAMSPSAGGPASTAASTPAAPAAVAAASPAAPSRAPAADADGRVLAVLIWLAGAGLLVGRTGVGVAGAAVRTARGRALEDRRIAALAHRAAEALGLDRVPWLAISDEVRVPMTAGLLRPAVLLPADARAWDADRLLHVFLHEFAHVARRDVVQGLVADLARALHWPNPLVWLAVARYRRERERACDDRVLQAGCRPSDYAGHLLGVAAGLRDGWRPLAGTVPMARPSELPGRIRAILDPALRRTRPGVAGRTATALTALAVVLPLAAFAPVREAAARDPDPAAGVLDPRLDAGALCSSDGDGHRSTSIDSDRRSTRIKWEVGDCRVVIDIRGDIAFGDDDRSIVSMESDARLEIDEDDGGTTRRLRLEGTGGGEFTARFWIDGDERPYEAEGRRWLADVLPDLFRETTLDAEHRVDRILAREGVDGVLDEIALMRSDHVIGTYYALLAGRESLSDEQTRRVLQIAMERVESDHYRYEILKGVLDTRGLPPELRQPYLAAVADIESDHYKAEALMGALDREDLDPETLEGVLATAAADIESDHYLAEILGGLVDEGPLSSAGRGAFLRALETVESDHYRSAVLEAFLDEGPLTDDEVADVLDLTGMIGSDHYKAELLQRMARDQALGGPARDAYLRAAAGIESDHYVHETAVALLDGGRLDGEAVGLVLDLAGGVESDHHRAEILLAVAGAAPLEGADRDRFLVLARGIESRHYRDQVLAAVVR